MKTLNSIIGLGAIVVITLFAGCEATDVVAKHAKKSFSAAVAASGPLVAWSEELQSWTISSPDGDILSLAPEARFMLDAAPFVDAGLDFSRLQPSSGIGLGADGNMIVRFDLGWENPDTGGSPSIDPAFAYFAENRRDRIGYHAALDHYGIDLGGGNMFEWAQDVSTNDKDIVFVLNPEPFIAAGIDPSRIKGWVFAKVETKDESGKMIQSEKLLKPFNLK